MKIISFSILLTFIYFIPFKIVSAQKVPKDFGLLFTFGFHKEDATVYDSKKKSLIVNGIDTVMTFSLKLSGEEKQTIYDELQKIKFIDYPEKYSYQYSDTTEAFISSPCQHYFLTIEYNTKSKKVEWNTCVNARTKDERHVALMNLDRVIEKIIWSRNPLKDYHPTRMRCPN